MVTAKDQQRAVELIGQAMQHQMAQDFDQAIRLYKESIALYPTADAHTYLGWAYSFKGWLNEAIAQCEIAIQLDPEFGNPYNDIGSYLIEQDQHREAIDWLQKALEAPRYGARHYAHFNLGRAYEHLGDWEAALAHYEQSLALNRSYNEARRAFNSLRAKLN